MTISEMHLFIYFRMFNPDVVQLVPNFLSEYFCVEREQRGQAYDVVVVNRADKRGMPEFATQRLTPLRPVSTESFAAVCCFLGGTAQVRWSLRPPQVP